MTETLRDTDAQFVEERPRLIRIVYRMLGATSDAEDVLQDAYLRWRRSGSPASRPAAYLKRIALNLCRDRLRRRSWLHYAGTWLPEPYLDAAVDGGQRVAALLRAVPAGGGS